MLEPESYWTWKGPPIPEVSDLPTGEFKGGEKAWNSLSPGMRREIWRDAWKRQRAAEKAATEDAERLQRADAKYRQSEVQIAARETI